MSTVYFLALLRWQRPGWPQKMMILSLELALENSLSRNRQEHKIFYILFSYFNSQSETPASLNSYGKAPSLPSSVSGGTLYFQMMNWVLNINNKNILWSDKLLLIWFSRMPSWVPRPRNWSLVLRSLWGKKYKVLTCWLKGTLSRKYIAVLYFSNV